MSLLSDLQPKKSSRSSKRRIGRGNGSGWGGTSGKGHKGQRARSGCKLPVWFEGGQMPIVRRWPKFGFTNTQFKNRYDVFNISQLEGFEGEVTPEVLKAKGWLKYGKVKILANGTLSKALTVKAHKFSAKARAAIESAGGKVEEIAEPKPEKSETPTAKEG